MTINRRPIAALRLDSRPVPTAYVRLALEALAGEAGDARAALLRRAGFPAFAERSWGPTLPFGEARRLLMQLTRSQPPGWHLQLAKRLGGAGHGPLGFAAITAPDLSTALDVLARYAETRAPFLWLTRAEERAVCRVECHGSAELGSLHQPLMELCLLTVLAVVTQVTGRDSDECRLRVRGDRKPHAGELQQLARCPIVFGADVFAIEMPSAWLRLPGILADPDMHRASLLRCHEALLAVAGASELVASLRQELLARDGASPGLEALARRRHITSRTLVRRLKRSGTSYRRIVDEVRAAVAAELLRNSELPVGTIGSRLGFADPANFGRAFRAWYGVSPRRFRAG
jgi:AraC-like DNA-binding protein